MSAWLAACWEATVLKSQKDICLGAMNANIGLSSICCCLNRSGSKDGQTPRPSCGDASTGVTCKTSAKSEVVALARILRRSSQKSREQKSSNRFSVRDSIGLIWILGALVVYIEGCWTTGLLTVRLHDPEIVGPLNMPKWV